MRLRARQAVVLWLLGGSAALAVTERGWIAGSVAGAAALWLWIAQAPAGLRARVVPLASAVAAVALAAWLRSGTLVPA